MNLSLTVRPRPLAAALTLICLTFPPTLISAQDPPNPTGTQPGSQPQTAPEIFTRQDADVVLTLHEVIAAGLEGSFSVYRWQQQYLQQAYYREASIRALRTRVSFSGTLPSVAQSISPDLYYPPGGGEPFIEYLRNGSANATASLTLEQQLITNGTIRLSSSLRGYESFRELPGGSDSFSRSVQPSVSFNFTQPLFQFNDLKASLRSNELAYEQLDAQYTETELALINAITQQFYALFRQQRSLDIQAQTFQQSDLSYQSGLRKFQAGLIAHVDALDLEVQRALDLASLQSARNTHRQAMYTLNRLLGLPLDTKVWADAEETLVYRPITVDVDRALERAFEGRAEVRLAEISLEQQQLNLEQTISTGRPALDLNIGYDLSGNSTLSGLGKEDPWWDHLRQAFDPDYRNPNTNVSLTLRIPVFDWGRNRAQVQGQRVALEVRKREIEEEREDLRRRVINQVEAVQTAMTNVENLSKAEVVASTSMEITRHRYERGEITLTDLLRSQSALVQAQNRYLDAIISYENAKAGLKEITLWDWETNQPVAPLTVRPEPFGRNR